MPGLTRHMTRPDGRVANHRVISRAILMVCIVRVNNTFRKGNIQHL